MEFRELSSFFQRLEQTSSRIEMTKQLAALFSKASVENIGQICFLLQGRVAPLYDAVEFGIAEKLMIRAVAQAAGTDEARVTALFKEQGDLGTAAEILMGKSRNVHHMSIREVFARLTAITRETGDGSQERKITLLASLFSGLDALSVRYAVRIPLDKLRLGFSDMTILDGFSWMLAGDKSLRKQLEDAYNVRPDLSYLGRRIKEKGIDGVRHVSPAVGAPILASLCSRLPSAADMIQKMGTVDVEPKYDGVRTQIHFRKTHDGKIFVTSFSRNLENTTQMYPELERIAAQIHATEVILDSEAVGFDPVHKRPIPFQETMTRKRKHDIAKATTSVPLKFFVFDMLLKDGESLMAEPLSQRRALLEKTIKEGDILSVSPHIVTDDVGELRSYHAARLAEGLEGVVVKKWESTYEPGRKGFHWVKFKEEDGKTGKLTDTVDGVVLGYYKGEGKRTDFGIGAFLVGVRDGERYVSLTKIGTGVTDAQWRSLRSQLVAKRVSDRPKQYEPVDRNLEPDVWVHPSMVVEIAADDITVSPIHRAGYALRFPRLVRIRTDKGPAEATTASEIRDMYKNQTSIR